MKKIAPQTIPLTGGLNFRDMGGYQTTYGKRIRNGVLFRSGALSTLTAEDCDYLDQLPIQHIIDYRDQHEVDEKPDKIWKKATYHHIPANPIQQQTNASLESMLTSLAQYQHPEHYMIALYQALPFNNPAYQRLIDLLQLPNTPSIVQHCAVGKDRTGVGCAIVLLILGCDESTIMEDYLFSEYLLAELKEHVLSQLTLKLSPEQLEGFSAMLSVNERYLNSALNAIKARYKNIDTWLYQEYGITDQIKSRIQENYLS